MAKDYYDILGVEKDASDDDLKKAYRRLARKYHPDRSTEEDAEAKFKEMKEAYDVLKDPAKRNAYDQWGDADAFGPGGGSGHTASSMTMEELLARMRAAGMDTSQFDNKYEQRETVQKIGIAVDHFINGGRAHFRYMNPTNIGLSFQHSVGHMDLQPNTKVGLRIKSSNIPNTTFILVPQSTTRCQVQGLDLVVPAEVNALSAAIGGKTSVQHPNGKSYDVAIPRGAKNGTGIRLSGLGLQHVNGAVGNLIAVVNYFVPVLDDETRDALKKLLESA